MTHRQQIHSKLVTIMRERLSKALKSFHSVSATWAAYEGDRAAAPEANAPRAPVLQQLTKQLATLAAVLRPVMSQAQLTDIFLRIRRMYGDSIARCVYPRCRFPAACSRSLKGQILPRVVSRGQSLVRAVQGDAQLAARRRGVAAGGAARRASAHSGA